MKNEEEYMDETQKIEGFPGGTEKKGICPVTYEMLKHSWLDEEMAKRIVKENLADDPDFYAFLEEEEYDEFADDGKMVDKKERGEKKSDRPVGFSITIGME